MNYLTLKSLHIIFVVTWFAGLFYMPRLFVYFAEAEEKAPNEKKILQAQFQIMQRRLWYGITIPSSLMVLIFGGGLLVSGHYLPLASHPWLIVKLAFVFCLYGYQYYLHHIFQKQQTGSPAHSPLTHRIINEISTVFLFAIVFLVIFKNVLDMLYGLIGLAILIILLGLGIKIYRNFRLPPPSPPAE